jgi:raffinose/stachyose/melibiose transport system substrate-binding protein
MKNKLLIIIICLLVASVSGCGTKDDENGGKAATDDVKKESDSNDKTSDEKIEITMMTAMAYGTEGLDIAVENYKKTHPNVTFDIQHIANDYDTVLKSRINSGQFPDIIAAQTGANVATYYDYAYDFTDDAVVDKFNEKAIAISKSSDEKLLSLPWTYETMGIIYNVDLFEEAGITTLPTTLAELEETCKILESKGILPFATAFKEQWVLAHLGSHFMTTQNEDPAVTIEAISNGELSFSDIDNFNNVYKMLDLMLKYGPDKPLEINWESSENMLANGEAAMIHMGDWCEATLKSFNPDVNVGFMPVPISEDPNDAFLLSSISWQLLLNKDSEHVDAAKEFMEYILTSEDGQRWMTEYVGAVPAAKTDMEPSGMLAKSAKVSIDAGMTKPWNHTLWPAGYNVTFGAYLQEYMFSDIDVEAVNEKITSGWLE